MIDEDINRLAEMSPDRPLDRLEADIWAGVAANNLAKRTSRVVASFQAGIMVIALVGAAAAGAASVTPERAAISSAGAALAPSTLLLGTPS